MEIFPKVNAGEFQLRLRAPDGTRIEVTSELASQAMRMIQEETREETGTDQVAISVGYCGLHPTSYTINNMYLWMRGPEEAVLRVGLKKDSGLDLEAAPGAIARSPSTSPGRLVRQTAPPGGPARGDGRRGGCGGCGSRSSRPISSTKS